MKFPFKIIAGTLVVASFAGLNLSGCSGDNHVKILTNNVGQENTQTVQWNEISKGLSYANILATPSNSNRKEFFVVKIDPKLFEFKIYNNQDQKTAKNLKQIHEEKKSLLTFNGAFFDESFKAMGLLQDEDSTSHKQSNSELMNGVFFVGEKANESDKKIPAGLSELNTTPNQKNWFMIQNGPILVNNAGDIPLTKDTGKLAARTAIGIDKEGNIIVIILHQSLLNTDNTLSLYQFAHLLKENAIFKPMELHSVLNLDGGPSTGIVIQNEYIPELNSIQNAVFTVPRA